MTTGEKGDNHPRWSPDGTEIAFLSSRDGAPQIYILPVDGGEARPVTDFPGGVGDFMWGTWRTEFVAPVVHGEDTAEALAPDVRILLEDILASNQ